MSLIVDALRSALGTSFVAVDPGFGPVTVDVEPQAWEQALRAAHAAGAVYLDFLTAYDLTPEGFALVAHVVTPDASDHVLVRSRLPLDEPRVGSATSVYPGAAWHERETAEMFGIEFVGHPGLEPLLLSSTAPSTPLRKSVVLVERPSRPWPGAKDPTDSEGRARRRLLPPGVPADWPAGPQGGPG